MASSVKGISDERLEIAVTNVATTLKFAEKHGLEAEVIGTAMVYLKENPDATISEALRVALSDWDV